MYHASNMKFSIGLLVYWIIGLFFLGFTQKVYAQTYSLSLSPPLLEIIIKPDKSITQIYKITNNGDPAVLTPHINKLDFNRQSGEIEISQENADNNWFKLENEDIILDQPFFINSNQTVLLNLNISIPQSVKVGDYYYQFSLTNSPPQDEKLLESYIRVHLSSNILISITDLGTLSKNGEITKFSAPIFLDTLDSLDIKLEMKNRGAAFFKPVGSIEISSLLNTTKYNIIPQNILVGSSRQIATAENTSKRFLIGPYRLMAKIKIDGTNIEIQKTKYLFAFPYKLVILLLGAGVIYKKFSKS